RHAPGLICWPQPLHQLTPDTYEVGKNKIIMRKSLFSILAVLIVTISCDNPAHAQQYKLRQVTNMMSMKMESTIYVKGMRKRTESAGIMGMAGRTTIEQCDL